jgi:hypothetical protein
MVAKRETEEAHMKTAATRRTGRKYRLTLCLIAGGLLFAGGALFAEPAETRLSLTTQSTKANVLREAGQVTTADGFAALMTAGNRSQPKVAYARSGTSPAQAARNDFWFYTADVVLFNDHDDDGYFHGIDLLFDADTYYDVAEVYAVVYLSLDGGPWNEYAVTEDFSLFGSSSEDEYVIVTELLSGYPSGSYDLLIELFDAYSGEFLAEYGPVETPELAFLPLEDAERDTPIEPQVVVVHEHGGGASGLWFLLALGLCALPAAGRTWLQR